jgi:uncharacterized protein
MSLLSRLIARQWRLPTAVQRKIQTEHLRIPMRDGVELVAHRHYSTLGGAQPTVLVRSCYGIPGILGTLFAERGFQVILQNCRGVGGSQGVFRPFFDEQSDGEDTVAWIVRQPWFQGDLALWGISYLGNTAWAIANSPAAGHVKAMGLHVTLSDFRDRTYAFGGFTLLSCFGWTITMSDVLHDGGMKILLGLTRARRTRNLTEKAVSLLPLNDADRVITPEGFAWWQDWMAHAEPGDPWWNPTRYSGAAARVPTTVMTAGWHDLFLPWQLRDFVTAQQAGRDVRMIIGPWMHADAKGLAESLRETMGLFQEQFGLRTPATAGKPRVRLFLMGADEWREYPSWPIPNTTERTYYLHNNGLLAQKSPGEAGVRAYDYDPARPTPSLHGPTLEGKNGSGDMAALERRSDVLVYTSEPQAEDLDVIGPVSGEVYLRSSTIYTDMYLCLCDVTPAGRSTNVCDGYVRLRAEGRPATDVVRKVAVEFWPTAYRFRRGHRLRILVASGAHPRYGRNPGTGAPLGEARELVGAHQEILHGPEYPTSIVVCVESAAPRV